MNTCDNCGGEGGFVEFVGSWGACFEDYEERWIDCPACHGSGWTDGDPPQLEMDEAFK